MADTGPDQPPPEVTVVNYTSWASRVPDLVRLLRNTPERKAGERLIPDPTGRAADPEHVLVVTDPVFWATRPQELAEVLAGQTNARPGGSDQSLGAAPASQARLTLTVEEAAVALGISRASANEAVRRHEIPSLRIGRRLLVPRAALNRLLDVGESEQVDDQA